MNMKQMMKQAQMMQKNMAIAQEEIATMTSSAESGGGMVKAVVNGNMEIQTLEIDKEACDPEDVEMLQDMIMAAVNEALREMNEKSQARLNSVTGGINIPGF